MKKQQIEEIEMIPVIREFLEQWKVKTFEWYIDFQVKYYEEKQKKYEFTKENLEKVLFGKSCIFIGGRNTNKQNIDQVLTEYQVLPEWKKEEWEGSLSNKMFGIWCKFYSVNALDLCQKNDDQIMKELEKEMISKYVSLVSRIEKKAGKIVDASGLYIGMNGEINGFVVGEKGSVKVETISAGGWNVQCYHFRVLVK